MRVVSLLDDAIGDRQAGAGRAAVGVVLRAARRLRQRRQPAARRAAWRDAASWRCAPPSARAAAAAAPDSDRARSARRRRPGGGPGHRLLVVDALPIVAPADFPRLDGVALTAACRRSAASRRCVTALMAGLLPAWRGSRARLSLTMKDDDGRSAGATSARLRYRPAGRRGRARAGAGGRRPAARPQRRSPAARRRRLRPDQRADRADRGERTRAAKRAARPRWSTACCAAAGVPGVTAAGAANMTPFGSPPISPRFKLPGRSGGRRSGAGGIQRLVDARLRGGALAEGRRRPRVHRVGPVVGRPRSGQRRPSPVTSATDGRSRGVRSPS